MLDTPGSGGGWCEWQGECGKQVPGTRKGRALTSALHGAGGSRARRPSWELANPQLPRLLALPSCCPLPPSCSLLSGQLLRHIFPDHRPKAAWPSQRLSVLMHLLLRDCLATDCPLSASNMNLDSRH